ncbi:hypothetical protein AbraIFM66950_009663 [Aspergillus brasiliensis]|nr:hypothetical protein AbraIFM66950_009663 [Aspergillus brasiliensis]
MRNIEIRENRFWPGDECFHHYEFMRRNGGAPSEDDKIRNEEIRYLTSGLLRVLSRCVVNSLQSFRIHTKHARYGDFENAAPEVPGLYLGAFGFLDELAGAVQNPSAGPDLEFLGIACLDFNVLKSILASPSIKANIRVLHLRQTDGFYVDSDGAHKASVCGDVISNPPLPLFRQFLEWTFGPEGPPKLQAVGHYASITIHPDTDVFYFRDEQQEDGYRCVIRHRGEILEDLHQYTHELDACRHKD